MSWRAPRDETVDAGGRELRVSSADRVIFPATERTPALTKLEIVQLLPRGRRRHPARAARAPDDARALARRRASGDGARDARGPARCADAFYQKRIPKGAPDYVQTARIAFPLGRTADEICPTELAVVAWCAQMGTITFHPWPVRSADVDHPDELRLDLDPQPGTDFAQAVRVAGVARELLAELGYVGFPKTSAVAASTCTCASSRAGRSPTCATPNTN